MDGTPSPTLPERLAALLGQASGSVRTEARDRRARLELRRAELAAEAQPLDAEELRRQAEELASAVTVRRQELTAREQQREELLRREEELEARLQAAHARLRSRCGALVAKLPLLDGSGAEGWVSWLDDWHHRHRRQFEQTADWQEYFSKRSTLAEALARIEPVVRQIHQLEVEEGELGIARSALPAEIAREEERIQELEAAVGERLQKIGGRYGRILEDLPEPAADDTAVRLEQIEGLLMNLETTLGRFAASARLESQMLEALQ
jgi:DNA repair exonuclease SbcCD ATPase subunit